MEWLKAKKILSAYAESEAWFGIHYNMNLYKGCSHGCIYCDSRSACYRIEHFDQVKGKENALTLLERELKTKRKRGVVGTGAMSDPYNPMERKYELTKGALKLLHRYGYGMAIATKSNLICRDIGLLQDISSHSPVLVKITITAAEDTLCKKIEPNVSPSSARFAAIRELSRAGIFVGVLCMPMLPFIEDSEENIQGIVEQAYESGAKFVYPAFGVTLRDVQREWYYKQLEVLFPSLKEKYIKTFGNAYSCNAENSKNLFLHFSNLCEEYGLLYKMKDIIPAYKKQNEPLRLSLF